MATQLDERKVEALADRVFGQLNGALASLNLYVGLRLGLFEELAKSGPVTPVELASRMSLDERYVLEWLECMVANEYLDHDHAMGRFELGAEGAAVLADRNSPAFLAGLLPFLPSCAGVLPQLLEAFRNGGGVPYEAYGADARDGIGNGNRPMYVHDYVSTWIPALPDIKRRLEAGGRVAEVGVGQGWSAIELAKGFPSIRVDAIDVDEASIAEAKANAAAEGVADRVTFHHAPIEKASLEGGYDLVTAFECLHDMPYPVEALSAMRGLAGPGGAVLIADERVAEDLADNVNPIGQFNYNCSVLHCLPQAMVFPGAAGTGTVIRTSTMRRYAEEAGFTSVDVLPIEHPLWRFYRLTP